MFEKLRIKPDMEIADHNGGHVGTVEELRDDRIALTRAYGGTQERHLISVDQVDRIEDNRIYLKAGTPIPIGLGPS